MRAEVWEGVAGFKGLLPVVRFQRFVAVKLLQPGVLDRRQVSE